MMTNYEIVVPDTSIMAIADYLNREIHIKILDMKTIDLIIEQCRDIKLASMEGTSHA